MEPFTAHVVPVALLGLVHRIAKHKRQGINIIAGRVALWYATLVQLTASLFPPKGLRRQ